MKAIKTENAPKAIGPYSQAIEANRMLFISGQIPINPKTGIIPEGIRDQTQQVMENIKAILHEAGYVFENIVKTTCLLSDMDNFKTMNEIYSGYFPGIPPARAAFAVKSLPLEVLIEIESIAVR